MDYKPAGKHCYGNYQPSNLCDACWVAEICKEETLDRDGYYDWLAEREEKMWELMEEPPLLPVNTQTVE